MLGYAIAIALVITRIANTDALTAGDVLGSIALGVALAVPPTLALVSLDRRPTLLPAAMLGLIASGLFSGLLGPVWLFVAYLAYRGWSARPVRAVTPRSLRLARIGVAAGVFASLLVLFVHVDPVCTQRLADGSVVSVDASTRGLGTGWAFNGGVTTTASSSGELGASIVSETCTSDTIVVGEALASMMVAGLLVLAGLRWPRGVDPAGVADDRPSPVSPGQIG
jgi:hypothetical protein